MSNSLGQRLLLKAQATAIFLLVITAIICAMFALCAAAAWFAFDHVPPFPWPILRFFLSFGWFAALAVGLFVEKADEEPEPVAGALMPETVKSMREAAANVRAMRLALKPFAAVADEYDDREDDSFEVWVDAGPERVIKASFRLEHYRAARAALNGGTAQ